jgi:CBS-domain-containing membrane protein
MINRKLADVIKGQKLVALAEREWQKACRYMWEHRTGSVLVLDDQKRLTGIFTGRDAVRAYKPVEKAVTKRAS